MNIPYHVYKHPKTLKNGKTTYRWYYYFYQDGKKIQKACRGCRTRTEAENYIRSLCPDPSAVIVKNIAETMYLPGSIHMEHRIQLGKKTEPITMTESRGYVKKILELWGDKPVEALDPNDIMAYLFAAKKSSSWKNRFEEIIMELYREARLYNSRIRPPYLDKFADNSRKADIFTAQELDRLFQPDNFSSKQYYLLFLLCLTCGLRLGEARGLRPKQFIFDRGILIIDGFCKQDGTRTAYNKKGNPDDPRTRIAFLTSKTSELMQLWIRAGQIGPEEYCFESNNKPIRTETAETVFYRALQKTGLTPKPERKPRAGPGEGARKGRPARIPPHDGRKLVPHSLRYTFVSWMLQHVTAGELMPFTGHASEQMVDYYDRRSMEAIIASMPQTVKLAAEKAFSGLRILQYPETPELDFYQAAD